MFYLTAIVYFIIGSIIGAVIQPLFALGLLGNYLPESLGGYESFDYLLLVPIGAWTGGFAGWAIMLWVIKKPNVAGWIALIGGGLAVIICLSFIIPYINQTSIYPTPLSQYWYLFGPSLIWSILLAGWGVLLLKQRENQ